MKDINLYKGKKVGVFASAGLNSWYLCRYLKDNGVDVIAFLGEVGQFEVDALSDFRLDMERAGVKVISKCLLSETAEMATLIAKYLASYEFQYWNSTSALRALLFSGFRDDVLSEGCDFYSHGCVGKGNDQRRFENYGNLLLGGVPILNPWEVAEVGSRAEMVRYIRRNGDYVSLANRGSFSSDTCLIGASYEGADYEGVDQSYEKLAPWVSVRPWDAKAVPEDVHVVFDGGVITSFNGNKVSALDLINLSNEAAGRNGISLKCTYENKINGTKCKGIYESPGMDLLGVVTEKLYQIVFTKDEYTLLREISDLIGEKIYAGLFFDQTVNSMRSILDSLIQDICAEVNVKLCCGNVIVESVNLLDNCTSVLQQKRFSENGFIWSERSI